MNATVPISNAYSIVITTLFVVFPDFGYVIQ